MRIFNSTFFSGKVTALLVTLASFACTARVSAQTTFSLGGTTASHVTGAVVYSSVPLPLGLGGVNGVGSSFAYAGTPSVLFVPETVGQWFTAAANGTSAQAGTGAWNFTGTSTGAFGNNTVLPISYNFTVMKAAGIISDVTWSLFFQGGANAVVPIATGTLTGTLYQPASANFSGSVSYNYTTGASASDTFQTYLEVAFTTNTAGLGPPDVRVMMVDTGFGNQGITIGASAIPEPSTYAAFAGLGVLGFAAWRRRRRQMPITMLV
jgi:fibronectin-binding autotransporter adhesin